MRPIRVRQALGELREKVDDALYLCKLITEMPETSVEDIGKVRKVSRKLTGAETDIIIMSEDYVGGETA